MKNISMFTTVVAFVLVYLVPLSPPIIAQDTSTNGVDLDSIGFERISDTVSIIDADDFAFDLQDSYGIFTESMLESGLLETGKTYYVIHKVEPRQTDFPNNTQFATVGYYFHAGRLSSEELFIETRVTGDSHRFAVGPEKPFFARFSASVDEIGKYTYEFYQHVYQYQDSYERDMLIGSGTGTGPLTVVEEYSKAIGEDGRCKMSELTRVIKHDYSTVVCTTKETKAKLQNRGWAL